MKVKFKRGIKRGYPVYVHGRQGKEQAFFPTKEDGRYCIDDFYFDSDIRSPVGFFCTVCAAVSIQ